MDGLAAFLHRLARRVPALRRHRRWWFRPAYEVLLLVVQTLSFAWLMQPEPGMDERRDRNNHRQ